MYCKNCGKKLPDNARFCDRCNASVRQKGAKMEIIEELKEERLARRKAQAIEQRLKNIKKVKRKRYKIVAAIALGVFVVWGIIFGSSYLYIRQDESLKDAKPELTQTQEPQSEAPKVTDIPDTPESYITAKASNIEFVYPNIFDQTEVSEACIASFADADGKAKLIIDKVLTDLEPIALMQKYANSIANSKVHDGESGADDTGYTITVTAGRTKYHKKSIVKDGAELSYELSYPAEESERYEAYIKYMDENFKVS